MYNFSKIKFAKIGASCKIIITSVTKTHITKVVANIRRRDFDFNNNSGPFINSNRKK